MWRLVSLMIPELGQLTINAREHRSKDEASTGGRFLKDKTA